MKYLNTFSLFEGATEKAAKRTEARAAKRSPSVRT